MKSTLIVSVAALLVGPAGFGQKRETPPYDPAPPTEKMSVYTNQDLAMTLFYPKEFLPRQPEDLQTVMERGHRVVHGTDPKSDPEHLEAIRCFRTLLYASSDENSGKESADADSNFGDAILVGDFDRSCMPKKMKGDKALTALAGTVLNLPGSVQMVQQMWFVAGGKRHVHSGMARNKFTPAGCSSTSNSASGCSSVPWLVVAAAFEQREHDILVVYLTGSADYLSDTNGDKHRLVADLSAAFEGDRPILLFPFLSQQVSLK